MMQSERQPMTDVGTSPHAIERHSTRVAIALSLIFVPPTGLLALTHYLRRKRLLADGDADGAEVARLKTRHWVRATAVIAISVVVVGSVLAIFLANDMALIRDFFDVRVIADSAPYVLQGFWLNVQLFMVAEVIMLAWALLVAVIRGLPGKMAIPVRWLATIYVDVFRGLPVLLIMLMVVFGLRRTGLPFFSEFNDFWLVVLAIVLAHGAYTAEIIKAAIDGVHPSQVSAARSLGLSYGKTLRYVVIPPATRSVFAPLLNGFIGLQKETSLVSFVGLMDAINFAQTLSIQSANLSAMTGAALCFLVITVPMTRFSDRLMKRDRQRTQGGSTA